jgi:hemerythrin-like domain-containing protein/glyoxylase-like metal-dependent hydrolase (beta-lactamase superfamily II)
VHDLLTDMRAIDQLRREHTRIAKMGEFLEQSLDPFVPIAVARALDFFTKYVDAYHHAKEERVLVPELLKRAYDVAQGPTLNLRKEHALFSAYLMRARGAFLDASKGDEEALAVLRRFSVLLAGIEATHAPKEEAILYSLTENLVPPSMDDVLLERFASATRDRIRPDEIAHFEHFVDDVVAGSAAEADLGVSDPRSLDLDTLAPLTGVDDERHDTAPSTRPGRILYDRDGHRCLLLDDFGRGMQVQANQYLIQDGDEGMVLDPGGPKVFPAVFAETMATLADAKLRYVFLSHQDPDVATALNAWLADTEADAYISMLWMRFLPHFGLDQLLDHRLKAIPDEGMTLQLGNRSLWVMPAHFLHSCGNFQVYDPTSKVLFSGDLGASFGSNAWVIRDFDAHEPGMRIFHQRYMASRTALLEWARKVRQLDVTTIAPQHGPFIRGREMVERFIGWCETLECGVDTNIGHVEVPEEFLRQS